MNAKDSLINVTVNFYTFRFNFLSYFLRRIEKLHMVNWPCANLPKNTFGSTKFTTSKSIFAEELVI